MPEELQTVKLQVGLLKQEVEARGRQIDALLSKLDSTADKIVELTVEIKSLNSRQERHSKVDDEIRSELKLLNSNSYIHGLVVFMMKSVNLNAV